MFIKINKKPIKQNSHNPLSENTDTCFTENHKISEMGKELQMLEEMQLEKNTNPEFEARSHIKIKSEITSENVEKNLSNEDLTKQDEIPSFDGDSLMPFENKNIHQKNYPVKENEAVCYDENDEISEEIPTFHDDLSLNNSDKEIISTDNNKGNNAFAFDSNYNSNIPTLNIKNKSTNDEVEASNTIQIKSKNPEKNLSNEDLTKNDEMPSFDDDSLITFDNRNIFSIKNDSLSLHTKSKSNKICGNRS